MALGMAGVVVLFIWGPPQPSHDSGVGLALEDGTVLSSSGRTVAEHNRNVENRRRFYTGMSRLGLALIFLGFLCQFVAVRCEDSQAELP